MALMENPATGNPGPWSLETALARFGESIHSGSPFLQAENRHHQFLAHPVAEGKFTPMLQFMLLVLAAMATNGLASPAHTVPAISNLEHLSMTILRCLTVNSKSAGRTMRTD